MARGAVRDGDGRLARSQRTRDAAVAALLDLVREGDAAPTVKDIAARAGVTARSLYLHFSTIEDLHRAAAERATAELLERIRPVPVDTPLAERITAVCEQRAVIHEHLVPLRPAAVRLEHGSPALASARRTALDASTDQVRRIFAVELSTLAEPTRTTTVAALDAVMGDGAWVLWRQHHELTVESATATMIAAVGALLDAALAGPAL